jgi:TPR repeat protein
VEKDYKEAEKLYRLAPTNPHPGEGLAMAESSLAVLYPQGHGVSKDWTAADRIIKAWKPKTN